MGKAATKIFFQGVQQWLVLIYEPHGKFQKINIIHGDDNSGDVSNFFSTDVSTRQ